MSMSTEPALDCSDKVYFPMTRTVKVVFVLLTFSLCVLGAIFSPKAKLEDREQRTHLVPVNNPQPHRPAWLRV
jgi:hypothetical protein